MAKQQKAYKQMEKRFASKFRRVFLGFFKGIGNFFVKIFRVFDSKLTVMIVPHSQSKVINFQTNVFALTLSAVIIVGIISSFLYFNRHSVTAKAEISNLQNQNRETLATLDQLRDENANLFQAAKRFQASLSQSLSLLGISQSQSSSNSSLNNSDLSALFSTKDIVNGSTREVEDIKELTSYLEDGVQPM